MVQKLISSASLREAGVANSERKCKHDTLEGLGVWPCTCEAIFGPKIPPSVWLVPRPPPFFVLRFAFSIIHESGRVRKTGN